MNQKAIKSYLQKARNQIKALNKRENKHGMSAFCSYTDFLWCYVRYGCLINQYVNGDFWRLRHHDRKRVMTYRGVVEFIDKCNSPISIPLLDNKILFNRHFNKFVKRQWLASEEMNKDEFFALAYQCGELIIKPLDECEGKGIELIRIADTSNNRVSALYDRLKIGRYIIEERIHNHPDMTFNNKSINTIRINSLMDKDGKVHLFKPVLRAGVGKAFVDNYNAGGCEYAIDLNTGIIISECYRDYRFQGPFHPGCDKIMPGYRIPMWQELLKTVHRACALIPECRFIGWDVAITPEGIQLIEGNHNPGNVGIEYFGERGWYDKLKRYL